MCLRPVVTAVKSSSCLYRMLDVILYVSRESKAMSLNRSVP